MARRTVSGAIEAICPSSAIADAFLGHIASQCKDQWLCVPRLGRKCGQELAGPKSCIACRRGDAALTLRARFSVKQDRHGQPVRPRRSHCDPPLRCSKTSVYTDLTVPAPQSMFTSVLIIPSHCFAVFGVRTIDVPIAPAKLCPCYPGNRPYC